MVVFGMVGIITLVLPVSGKSGNFQSEEVYRVGVTEFVGDLQCMGVASVRGDGTEACPTIHNYGGNVPKKYIFLKKNYQHFQNFSIFV